MLNGIDISKHNKNMKNVADLNKLDFVIMKASEGATYRDASLSYYMLHLESEMLKGFYHFARPENGNSAKSEASNFLSSCFKYIDGRSILALDVEAAALTYTNLDKWVIEWCEYVYNATGIKPMIYCSVSECHRFKKAAKFSCGLWVAKWSIIKPSKTRLKPWEFFAIWQDSNKYYFSGVRCDHDKFNGTKEQYLKYCKDGRRDG